MKTSLIVVDDPVILGVLSASLGSAGFHVVATDRLDDARELAARVRPDIVLIDIDPYPPEALVAALDWKASGPGDAGRVPTLMLTERPDERCGVRGALCGAALCVAKPFRPRELVMAAVRLVRRSSFRLVDVRWSGAVRQGPIELDLDLFTMTVDHDGRRIPFGLGPTVTRILAQLMRRPGAVCSRDELLAQVWSDGAAVTPRTVDQNIRRIRAALREVGLADAILTVGGQGYSFVLPTEGGAHQDPRASRAEARTAACVPRGEGADRCNEPVTGPA
jgi:DNA-binding response OmpR family regulator